jgi:vitamin B12 transporter
MMIRIGLMAWATAMIAVQVYAEDTQTADDEDQVTITSTVERKTSAPTYQITGEEIRTQGSDSAAETLRSLPGFAVNDAGYGADIHTGTYYRGHSINQSVYLINGRSFGSNVSTYHGGTDLNSIPVGTIDRVELSSGSSSTLYGAEAFGGVVNIITREGSGPAKFNGLVRFGSFGDRNYQGQVTGSSGGLSYALSYERAQADNDYRVPKGAANRGPDGRLFNGDGKTDSYYANLGYKINDRNALSFDLSAVNSKRGLLYFGFPLQRDRLDHDGINAGLNWTAKLGGDLTSSTLKTSIGYSKDSFETYGPTGSFYRTGRLNTQSLLGRIDHDWSVAPKQTIRWGIDAKRQTLTGEANSSLPTRIRFNETEERNRNQVALFALHTWKPTDSIQTEFGLRQSFNSEFGSNLNPSAGIRWQAAPAIALRGSFSSLKRIPGLDQLYVYDTVHGWLPNPNLDPETGYNWSLGADFNVRNLNGSVTLFGSDIKDRMGIQAGRWENIGRVGTTGLETSVNWQIDPKWNAFANYTYTSAKIQDGPDKGLQLSTLPYSVGKLGISYSSNGWQSSLYGNYFSGARRALFVNAGESTRDFSDPWFSVDLSLRAPIARQLGLTIFLENLFNKSYEKVNRIYQPGLTYRVGLQGSF